ncbi:MAG TPA: hypothetical protein VLK89_01435 [Solirubrobacterales bacterium]|nr:hypothetical protein [Solirubrobacterales bacterium]
MRHPLLDRMATRRAQAARMDVEDRRAERQADKRAGRRPTGNADAGRGHLHHDTPAFEPDGPNEHTPRG